MLKVFWDKDNIAFISDRINAAPHSHCVIQACIGLTSQLCVTVGNERVVGKCIVVNKNAPHEFSCDGALCLSVLIQPSSQFAKELSAKIGGDYAVFDDEIEPLRRAAAALTETVDKFRYLSFIAEFAAFLGVRRSVSETDARIAELLTILRHCDCYDHTIKSFAKKLSLSPDRLSHLFREQAGVPLKSYILYHMLEKAFYALLDGKSVTDAAMSAGFDSPSHFAATVKKQMGMTATALIKDSEFLKVFS